MWNAALNFDLFKTGENCVGNLRRKIATKRFRNPSSRKLKKAPQLIGSRTKIWTEYRNKHVSSLKDTDFLANKRTVQALEARSMSFKFSSWSQWWASKCLDFVSTRNVHCIALSQKCFFFTSIYNCSMWYRCIKLEGGGCFLSGSHRHQVWRSPCLLHNSNSVHAWHKYFFSFSMQQ